MWRRVIGENGNNCCVARGTASWCALAMGGALLVFLETPTIGHADDSAFADEQLQDEHSVEVAASETSDGFEHAATIPLDDSCVAGVPLSTLMEPSGFQGHGARGGRQTRAEHDTASQISSIPPEAPVRAPEAPGQRLRLRMGCSGFVTGAAGGGSSSRTLGLRRARYDSPSTMRS